VAPCGKPTVTIKMAATITSVTDESKRPKTPQTIKARVALNVRMLECLSSLKFISRYFIISMRKYIKFYFMDSLTLKVKFGFSFFEKN
jgi:hypothetical protein